MRIAKYCLALLALVTCALIRTSFHTLSRPDFYFTLWTVSCYAATCLCVDVYFKRSRAGHLSLPWHMGATAIATLGLAVPLAIFDKVVGRGPLQSYTLVYAAMAVGLLVVLCSWQHWAIWILAGGTGNHPPRPIIASQPQPETESQRPSRIWKFCKVVAALCATGLILWTLATDSGASLYVALVVTLLAAVVIGIATTYFRRINADTLPEKSYYGEVSFGVFSLMTFIPLMLHDVLPPGFDHAGVWLMLFCVFVAGGPALLTLLTGLALDMQKSVSKLSQETPPPVAANGNPTAE